MTRLSFRPRPLDVNKKLAIVRSIKELDGEDGVVSRSVHHGHIALDADNEPVLASPAKKGEAKEIPTPQCQIVKSYDTLYPQNFQQPATYVRRRPARAETEQFVEYDLDDEDEDWLDNYNNNRNLLPAERFEVMLYQLELADARSRMKTMTAAAAADSQVAAPAPFVLGVKIPVFLPDSQAVEILRPLFSRQTVVSSVCEYWKLKREKLGKPLLRRLQPPPAVTDTNPFNVFRPREKAHRPNTRRMQRRENDVASFDKLQQVKKSLEDAQKLLAVLQKREETKKELMDCEFHLQRAALHDPAVGQMYLEREAKRIKLLQQPVADHWPAASTPAGPRLKVLPPAPEDTTDPKSSLTRDSGLDFINRGVNGFHTPVVATKRRSASASAAAAAAAAASGGGAAPTAVLAAAAAGNTSSLPPQPPVIRVKFQSPSIEGGARQEPARGGEGLGGEASQRWASPELHQLQLHKRKRRRNMFPLRGAAAASAAAAATARLNAKLHGGSAALATRILRIPAVKEPPRPAEPVMAFAQPVDLEFLRRHLHVCVTVPEPATRAVADTEVHEGASDSDVGDKLHPGLEVPSTEEYSKAEAAAPSPSEVLCTKPFGSLPADQFTFQSLGGRPRFGRGGRLVFDRWDVLQGVPLHDDLLSGQLADVGRERKTDGRLAERPLSSPTRKSSATAGAPVAFRFAVHKHRSAPRWRHPGAIAPITGGTKLPGSDPATTESLLETDLADNPEELPPLITALGDSPSSTGSDCITHATFAAQPSARQEDTRPTPQPPVKNGVHKGGFPSKAVRADHKEVPPRASRNSLHTSVGQQLVPA